MKEYTQEYLKSVKESFPDLWDMTNEQRYDLARIFTEEKATQDNYFENSIGFWEPRKSRPRRKPDHTSLNTRGVLKGYGKVKVSSEYWYTEEGIIRGSDHWGSDVASCSWFIKGERYSDNGVSKGTKRYAFIAWDDLKAKGIIGCNAQTKEYFLAGFTFEK